jgi:D-glycero-D-manno-heptose 1,7-bisphosphate phosphatase
MELNNPNTIVIACGGKGNRLKPVTEIIPKPLLKINGVPFLENILNQFAEVGARKFHLLLGYKYQDFIPWINYWKKKFDLEITFSISNVECETGERLILSKLGISGTFVFLYGDVFLPLNKDQRIELTHTKEPIITVYSGAHRDSSRNLQIVNDRLIGYVNKNAPEANAVNCGYFTITPENYSLISPHKSVEDSILNYGKFRAISIFNKYYTVGNVERLSQTRSFFDKKRRILLMDRDGTITLENQPGDYLKSFSPEVLRFGSIEFLKKARTFFDTLIVITNQPQVGNLKQSYEDMLRVNSDLNRYLDYQECGFDAFFICAHGWNEGCFCRKPNPGLMYDAQNFFDINWQNAVYIGDMERDAIIAKTVGCEYRMIDSGLGLMEQFMDDLFI